MPIHFLFNETPINISIVVWTAPLGSVPKMYGKL